MFNVKYDIMSYIMSNVKSIVMLDDIFNVISDIISDVFLGNIFELKILDKEWILL